MSTSQRRQVVIDGNTAAAYVAHKLNEVIAIYPITPSSTMGELADEWSSQNRPNLWGIVPSVTEMQSEAGAAGAVHGALQTGALSTTFTASQGLLLMIPNMFKIAGELTPTVFHVASRSVATHALSIFGDHSDVMATRSTGFALLASNSVQEVMDFALIAQAASLQGRVPVLHFFDGFRTSHEVTKVEELLDDDMRAMIDEDLIRAHRLRALSPDHPVLRGSAQNPDVFFQAREAANPYYAAFPAVVQETMDKFARLLGRNYHLFDYVGPRDAQRVIVLMGSGAETAHETVEHLVSRGEKVGLVKVRLYRPFSSSGFVAVLPPSVKTVAVLDRTKEPGSAGEPLYLDVCTAILEAASSGASPLVSIPRVIGGRYGLSSKEFTPAMVKALFDEMKKEAPKNHFTLGISDDVTNLSINFDPSFTSEPTDVVRAVFYGLGADGTVSANKNSITIIGEETDNHCQGYFVYDSKKSGSTTISHLRFGPKPIRSTYLITRANFVACHQWFFLERYDVLKNAVPGGTFLLNSYYAPHEVWERLPREVQEHLIKKRMKFYVIDAYSVAQKTGMGGRINTIMQTCFFALSGILPREQAIAEIKNSILKTYGKKGEQIVKQNFEAVDYALAYLHEVQVPTEATSISGIRPPVSDDAPAFVKNVTAPIIAGLGDELPVSAMPPDGTFPVGTARWEKRNIGLEIPAWDEALCIQCNKCAIVCPHASIRVKVYDASFLQGAPSTFKSMTYKGPEHKGMSYTVQVAPEDCTGCGICVDICPAKNKSETRLKALNMIPQPPLREQERVNYEFFLGLPEVDRRLVRMDSVKDSQFLEPLFEYSGACSGCGETPYVKLLTQLFGDRMIVANATGCSSIYGGNLPTAPWTTNRDGRGPAWSNSLFEDNAEFGLGMRLTVGKLTEAARELVQHLSPSLGSEFARELLSADQSDEAGIYEQRARVRLLKERLTQMDEPEARRLLSIADNLVKRSIWIIGGDGWAYDIGFGGLDHVLASGKDVNVLVLDTEVYSNTGGQMSKATPRAAVAKFAAGGKPRAKKDLGLLMTTYGDIFVAQVAMGYNDTQTIKAFLEAEAYNGPSLIIAYSHCIAHGINMTKGMMNQRMAVESGHWPLYRFNPALSREGKNPMRLDSKPPKIRFEEYAALETRFKMLSKANPAEAKRMMELTQDDIRKRWEMLEHLAQNGNGKHPVLAPLPATTH
jgi:pyruvate-ferredoxin/flavodoxin oxidoreductase